METIKNSDSKCGIEFGKDYNDTANCYGIKAYADQHMIIDVFEVTYNLCWEEDYA